LTPTRRRLDSEHPAKPIKRRCDPLNEQPQQPALSSVPTGAAQPAALEDLLADVARGDQAAFAALYDRVHAQVYGLVRRVLRDPSQSEEITQEVLLDVWRTASRFDRTRGSASAWIMTQAHRRAVDRVRSEQSSRNRDTKVAVRDHAGDGFDEVAETVEVRLEHQQVRQAMDRLTDLQRESIELAYYGGYTYREVADLLDTPLGTVKTRLRDGLIRMRDAMGVTA
jgi:RNA polymerase sigma-70 factor, ECF subfamily